MDCVEKRGLNLIDGIFQTFVGPDASFSHIKEVRKLQSKSTSNHTNKCSRKKRKRSQQAAN